MSSSACATPAARAARSRAARRHALPRSPAAAREPVEVTYEDGTTETIDYTVLIAITLGVDV